jgi:hypothetical protein
MPLGNPSPACTVNAAATTNGVNVTASSTVTIALADASGVKQWAISCFGTDDGHLPAVISASLTVDYVAKTATFTAPAAACALLFQSVVNNGKDGNGNVDPTRATTFGIYVLTAHSHRLAAFGETLEGNAAFGWVAKFNDVVRAL